MIVREVEGELLILDTGTNRIHQLNPTASLVWELCQSPMRLEDIAARLATAFDVDARTALTDVEGAVSQFRTLGLLDMTDASGA